VSFAVELSERLRTHQEFRDLFARLQSEAVSSTLPEGLQASQPPMGKDEVLRLLYCAGVFVQTDDEAFRSLAQSIALGTLLARRADIAVENSTRLLADLGNFPALSYTEAKHGSDNPTLSLDLRKAISRELNAIEIGGNRISLTDFQKKTWDKLSHTQALAVSAPTSAGKSFMVIEHLCRTIESAPNLSAIYVAPTRALLSEVYSTFRARLADADVRVSTVPTIDENLSARQIFVLTQERLQVLLAVTGMKFDVVIVDEAQNFSDGARGMILQESLEQVLARNPKTKMVMLAPGAEGFENLGRAIGVDYIEPAVSLLPSVIQNRVLVSLAPEPMALRLRLLTAFGIAELGVLRAERGFQLPASRLAAVALELGNVGGSLVYSTGAKDAEDVALQIYQDSEQYSSTPLKNLSNFIASHIHEKYGLVDLVRRGVAFHYGKMPTLLREAIEGAFKAGDLKYLCCTTTLFQGVNLPARNVFIDTPTRGSGAHLDPAALWNFAGRAGRMKMDIVGNVFLVDYDDWPDKPMDSFVGYRIEPAFGKTAAEHSSELITALEGSMPETKPRDDVAGQIRAAAGLLISRAARGDLEQFVQRGLQDLPANQIQQMVAAAHSANSKIDLPANLLATNWTVDPFGLRRLFDEFSKRISAEDFDELIPKNPHTLEYADAKRLYGNIFSRVERLINLSSSRLPYTAAGTAVKWMKGLPYPALLSGAVKRAERRHKHRVEEYEAELAMNPRTRKRRPKPPSINDVIRREFDLIEDVIRFRYVQLAKAYIEVLSLALTSCDRGELIGSIFDFGLALELGISTRSGWSFMELGLSRIAATALQPHFPNSELSVARARNWLAELEDKDLTAFQLSPVIVEELMRLNLVQAA